jgi:SAM-dependent methyltransferase
MTSYDRDFFAMVEEGSSSSARVVLPLLLRLTGARSLIDVGCGTGAWLAAARQLGVERLLGVDGHWVDSGTLLVDQFEQIDLGQPFTVSQSFDMALSLEVAEHLPAERAESFVADLTRLAPVVAFSAAVPGQGGVGHLNEQWPDFWRDLFSGMGYQCFDVIRSAIWNRPGVMPWYAQNLFLYAQHDHFRHVSGELGVLRVVHPLIYENCVRELVRCQQNSKGLAGLRARWQLRGRIRSLFG